MALTSMMQQVIDKISALPAEEQNMLASVIEEEMEANQRWNELFADPRSEKVLGALAAKARNEHRGRAPSGAQFLEDNETIDPQEADELMAVIEEGCEQVDLSEW